VTAIGARLIEQAAGREVFAVTVVAVSRVAHWTPPRGISRTSAVRSKGTRPIFWDGVTSTPTPIYDRETLAPGDRIEGPAVVEGSDTTYAVSLGWNLAVHPTGCFMLTRS
jgi:N-methylhydantoinase A